MELPLATVDSPPLDPILWEKPAHKVASYLEAHGFRSRVATDHLLYSILHRVAADHGDQPASMLEKLALDEAERRLLAWFRSLFPETPENRLLSTGRLAMLLDGHHDLHLQLVEHPKRLPAELRPMVQVSSLQPVVLLQRKAMKAHPLNPGPIYAAAGEAKMFLERMTFLRILLSWLLFLAILTVLFLWTR